jgi:hypothetical protein
MARPRGVAAAAALAVALLSVLAHAHLEFGNYKVQQIANEVVSFLMVGEWGGQSVAPYTTPGQLAVASAMAGVATTSASTFVLSPGGNFYGDGIQGARPARPKHSGPKATMPRARKTPAARPRPRRLQRRR